VAIFTLKGKHRRSENLSGPAQSQLHLASLPASITRNAQTINVRFQTIVQMGKILEGSNAVHPQQHYAEAKERQPPQHAA
jgi:hypothetical protein